MLIRDSNRRGPVEILIRYFKIGDPPSTKKAGSLFFQAIQFWPLMVPKDLLIFVPKSELDQKCGTIFEISDRMYPTLILSSVPQCILILTWKFEFLSPNRGQINNLIEYSKWEIVVQTKAGSKM